MQLKKLLLLIAATSALLCSCAAPPQVAPKFYAPSVVPVKRAIATSAAHIQNAQGAAKRIADDCKQKSADWNAAYKSLTDELTQAYDSTKVAQEALAKLKAQEEVEISEANKLGQNYNRVVADNVKLTAIKKEVDSYWGLGAFAYGFKTLAKHLLIAAIVIVVLGVILAIGLPIAESFFPAVGVALTVVKSFFRRILSMLKPKPPPTQPPSP